MIYTTSFSLPVVQNGGAQVSQARLGILDAKHLNRAERRGVLVVGQNRDAVRIFERWLDG